MPLSTSTKVSAALGICLQLIWIVNSLGAEEKNRASLLPPTDNPVATFYFNEADGSGYPAWTDQIVWSRTIDMKNYNRGETDFERFEAARDELAALGGGVLYYPVGTYDFTKRPAQGSRGRGLMLKPGIVIRGEAPTENVSAMDETFQPRTRFIFGRQNLNGHAVPQDWNLIGLYADEKTPINQVHRVGICWVHLEDAVIYFGPALRWGISWGQANAWRSPYTVDPWKDRVPDGTHPLDAFHGGPLDENSNGGRDPDGTPYQRKIMRRQHKQEPGFVGVGRGRLVFGCRLERSCLVNVFDRCGRPEAPEGWGEQGFHMARYAARIGVYGSRVLVANNRLPTQAKEAFEYDQITLMTRNDKGNSYEYRGHRVSRVLFDYDRTMGINVNKGVYSCIQRELMMQLDGGFHEPGAVVIDNYVFSHGHKGFELSGNAMTVQRNRNERRFLKSGANVNGIEDWRLTLDGHVESSAGGGGMISDNYSRAFDLGGINLWIDRNRYDNLGSNPGNDGEGILCQYHNGTHWLSWACTNNLHELGEPGCKKGYIGAWGVVMQGAFIAWNQTPGWIGAESPWTPRDLTFLGSPEQEIRAARTKALTQAPAESPSPPENVTIEIVDGDAVMIRWQDTSEFELGFRIDRRIGSGNWQTIAYRPPQIETSRFNLPLWLDVTAPPERTLTYRVVAVDGEDSARAASAPVSIVLKRNRP